MSRTTPLVFVDEASGAKEAQSGGNFYAEPVAFAADNLAVALAEIGALAERRTAMLMDAGISGLPAFLIEHGGWNSGFMIAQVTLAALASENKLLAHPASVDSVPTSATQEEHVSMAIFAAPPAHDARQRSGRGLDRVAVRGAGDRAPPAAAFVGRDRGPACDAA